MRTERHPGNADAVEPAKSFETDRAGVAEDHQSTNAIAHLGEASLAGLLGLANRNAVSVYRGRCADFPEPVVASDAGRCLLWLRQEVERWAKGRKA